MDPQIIVGLIAIAGVLLTQILLHRRWTREQDEKRVAVIAEQDQKRQDEQAEMFRRMAEQNSAVVADAVTLVEQHRADALAASVLAKENAEAHALCREEVAHVNGMVEELRARIVESERTFGDSQRVSEIHQALKHDALNALTVSEGITSMVVPLTKTCTCHVFDPLTGLLEDFRPQAQQLVAENMRLLHRPKEDQ